jgi:inorganic pyrophosphatase
MTNNFPKVWIHKELKKHKEDLIDQAFTAELHKYQDFVVSNKRLRKYSDLQKSMNNEIQKIREKLYNLERCIYNERNFLYGRLNVLPVEYSDTYNRMEVSKREEELEKNKKENLFRQRGPCPAANCRGFIEENWTCKLCDTHICRTCMMTISTPDLDDASNDGASASASAGAGTDHVCKQEDVESAQKIREDSRNCPSCRVRIFKISGCNQMWCTNCHTFFSWDTLKIINGKNIHNPHFIEYTTSAGAACAANGTGAGAEPIGMDCNRIQAHEIVDCVLDKAYLNKPKYAWTLEEFKKLKKVNLRAYLATVHEMTDHVIGARNRINTDFEETCKRIGIRYLENTINDNDKKIILQRKRKELDKLRDATDVRELWKEQIYTIIYRFLTQHGIKKNPQKCSYVCMDTPVIDALLSEIANIDAYCEDALRNIGNWYNSTKPQLFPYTYMENRMERSIIQFDEYMTSQLSQLQVTRRQ